MVDFTNSIRERIDENGLKLVYVSKQAGISYQRLNRIFNQGAQMSASELLALCSFLKINPNNFVNQMS